MIWLILGVCSCGAARICSNGSRPDVRARMGEKGKGLVALALLVSIVLMVIGYRMADGAVYWGRSPAMTGHQQPADAAGLLPVRGVGHEDAGNAA